MIHSISGRIVGYCLDHGIVSSEDSQWLQYGIEKRISHVLNLIPFTFLAIWLSDWGTAISFIGAFCFLKQKTGGIHAQSVMGCVFVSLLTELLFLVGLYPHLSGKIVAVSECISALLIFVLAPHNHPNMHLSFSEIQALREGSRKCAVGLVFATAFLWKLSVFSIAKGLTMGMAMAAFLLSLAYINDWRVLHENEK